MNRFATFIVLALLPLTFGLRPLSRPQADLCASRGQDFFYKGHRYLFSWNQAESPKLDWIDARNYCRNRCMDLVAVEESSEWDVIAHQVGGAARAHALKGPSGPGIEDEVTAFNFWTSGRLCDFDGCEKREAMKPLQEKGWFWSANNKAMSHTTCVPGYANRRTCFHKWSSGGKYGFPQPDNREMREEGVEGNESCLAAVNGADLAAKFVGVTRTLEWHDMACYHQLHFVCEDSDLLLRHTRRYNPSIRIP